MKTNLEELLKGEEEKFPIYKNRELKVVKIKPNQAKFILNNCNNTVFSEDDEITNRSVGLSLAEKYSRYMKEGDWLYSGDNICFSENGELLDGQHRLIACLISNTPFETSVAWGLERRVFKVKDTGKNRSLADVLHIEGLASESKARALAAVARILWNYEKGFSLSNVSGPTYSNFTHEKGVELIKRHPNIHEYLEEYSLEPSIRQKSIAAFLYYIFSEKSSKEEAKDYFDKVLKSEGLIKDSIEHKIHQTLLRDLAAQKKMTKTQIFNTLIKGWNYIREGQTTLKRIELPTGNNTLKIK